MRTRGFSLLEVLVALAVFAVLAAMAWGGLDTLSRSRQILDAESERLARLQRGLLRFERDLRQAVPRAARSEGGGQALLGEAQRLELSVWLPSDGWSATTPDIERVAWRCDDDGLHRTRFAAVDYSASTPRSDALLVPGARNCRLRYFPERGPADSQWPARGSDDVLPQAIELQFDRERDGVIESFRRLIELPQAAVSTP
ncbi:MAG TPA: type II secretion system minor pseudopilin GspJ [Arenimonas sp.]|nr:type II secretion system minor pseudopilin GspJ [Arenimonas sp.]